MRNLNKSRCLVLLSGGQDSATCLSWAKNKFYEIHTISFNYGQKHVKEIEYSRILSKLANAISHTELNLQNLFSQVTSSALMDKTKDVSSQSEFDNSLPASFVPFRNLQFLVNAGSIAYIKNIKNLVTGVCQTDFCVPGTTFVTTIRGKIPMHNIQVGDFVLSKNLKTKVISFKEVLNKWDRGQRDDIIEIIGEGGRRIKTTSNHKIFKVTRSDFNSSTGYEKSIEKIEAKDLKIGDFMLTPSTNRNLIDIPVDNPQIDLLEYCDLNHHQLSYNDTHIWFKANNKVKRFVDQNSVIQLLCWFITEGSKGSGSDPRANKYRVAISQSFDKNPSNYNEIKTLISNWGFNISDVKSSRGDTNLYFSGPTTKIFDLCGNCSVERQIPHNFVFANIKLIFDTLIKGDGSVYDNGSNIITTYTTKSWLLKEQICWIAQMLGYSITVNYHPVREIYNITMHNNFKKNMNRIHDSKLFKIKEINKCESQETVYDIEVKDNNTFFAGEGSGMLISNSGYPDCRDVFIKSLNVSLNLAGDCDLNIFTPLMWLTKAETIKLMQTFGTLDWYRYTLTCYNGTNCGTCPSCKLRIKGFEEAGVEDPIEYLK